MPIQQKNIPDFDPIIMKHGEFKTHELVNLPEILNTSRFGYFDFRQKFLNLSRNSAFLPKILCRIQIWASKREIQAGQNFKH